jgi:hypothetical protein
MSFRRTGAGYWKWLRNRRIREVFVVGNITNPDAGKIDKIRIKRKTGDSIELADCGRFDVKTGRSLYGDPKYIVPVEDRRVWEAWELQSLRQRVECALPELRFKDVRAYADMLVPNLIITGEPPPKPILHPGVSRENPSNSTASARRRTRTRRSASAA